MCDKAIQENSGTLKSLPDCYKTQKICDEAVDTYPSTIKFVPKCFMTQEICDKAIDICFFVFFCIFS